MIELKWEEFFPNFFEAKILDARLFVNMKWPEGNWEFYVGSNLKYRGDKWTAFKYAELFANHYYKSEMRIYYQSND